MKKYFKLVSLFISLAVVMSVVGCANKNSADADNTIHWYMLKPGDDMSDEALVESAANEILEKEVGLKLDLHMLDSASYDKKMNTMIAAGEEFDLCMTASWTNDFVANVQRGAFVDIKPLLEKYGKDILEKSDPVSIDALTMEGKMFALKSQTPYSGKTGRAYKKDLVEKYNFDYENAKTLEELEPFLKQIKDNEPGITPLLVTAKTGVTLPVNSRYTDDSIVGLNFDEETQQYIIAYERPDLIENYKKVNEFYKKGYIASKALTLTDTVSEAKSAKYAVMPVSGNYTEDASKSSDAYGFECVETYLGDKIVNTGAMFDTLTAVSVTSKKPEKAIKLLNCIWANPELSNLLAYGLENVNYVIDEERSNEIGEKSVIPKSGNEKTWGIPHNWIGPLWDQWDSSWNRKDALLMMQEVNKSAAKSSTLGFLFDSSEFKTELAQISSIVAEAKPVFNTGSMPDFDEYHAEIIKKLKASGIDKVVDAANEQLNNWKANNGK